jgi:AmiR/NasT family two-component response regulator
VTKPSPFSVRGRKALVVTRDEREASTLGRQLDRLGMTMARRDPEEVGAGLDADVLIVDADALPARALSGFGRGEIPIVALIGTETPSRLKHALDLDPASFLIKPLRSSGLYAALALAFDVGQKRAEAARRIARLEERVRARRVVLAAILRVMARDGVSESEAFACIRHAAMESRATVEDVSARIVGEARASGAA